MMFLYLSLLYMGDIPLVSFYEILDYSSKKKKKIALTTTADMSVARSLRDCV